MNETQSVRDDSHPIDAYLDELLRRLAVRPDRVRRILTECEDHLREAADRHMAAGLDADDAERVAVVEFGAARTVARRFAAEEGRLLPPSLTVNLAIALAALGGVGLVAIGLSGVLAAAMGAASGKAFVSGDAGGITYTAARCADFLRFFPHAGSCEAAATAHHFEEVVTYRAAAGVLGLLALAGVLVVRLRYPRLSGVRLLPAAFAPTVGASLFGVAAAALMLQGLAPIAFGDATGAGAWLSGGIVSLAAFAWYGTRLARTLRAA